MNPPTKEKLNSKLKKSYALKKRYQGKDELRFVPGPAVQIKTYLDVYPDINALVDSNGKLLIARIQYGRRLF